MNRVKITQYGEEIIEEQFYQKRLWNELVVSLFLSWLPLIITLIVSYLGFLPTLIIRMGIGLFTGIVAIAQTKRMESWYFAEKALSEMKVSLYSIAISFLSDQSKLKEENLNQVLSLTDKLIEHLNQIIYEDLDPETYESKLDTIMKETDVYLQTIASFNQSNEEVEELQEELKEPQKEKKNPEKKECITQNQLITLLQQYGLYPEQILNVLNSHSKQDYETIIILLETNLISKEKLYENFSRKTPISMIDANIKRKYDSYLLEATTEEQKNKIKNAYHKELLDRYLILTEEKPMIYKKIKK